MNPILRVIATGCFTGYSPFAPGTAGSALAFAIYCFLPPLSPSQWLLLIAALTAVAVPASTAGEREWGKDPPPVVIDEVVGYFATAAFLPQSVTVGVAAFFVFRFTDILKPPPARQAEALPRGWGIVADDLFAGIYGNLLVRGVLVAMASLGIWTP